MESGNNMPETLAVIAARAQNTRVPGTHLHRIIERLTGEHPTAGCGCENFISEMNALGSAGCREPKNLERFTERIHEQAKARGWKVLRVPGTKWLGKTLADVPGAKTICRRIVLAAIRRAEREVGERKAKVTRQYSGDSILPR